MKTILAATLLFSISFLAAYARADEAAVCLECHLSKSSPVTAYKAPALAGQHPQYIVRQLERFAAAHDDDPYRRINTAMAHTLRRLQRSEWGSVADTLSGEQCAYLGNADLPTFTPNPCASCHGPRGISDNPEIPNLAGQDLRYLFYQYQKLREPYMIDIPGIEKDRVPQRLHPVMGPLGAQINDKVVSIMMYYSKLPCR